MKFKEGDLVGLMSEAIDSGNYLFDRHIKRPITNRHKGTTYRVIRMFFDGECRLVLYNDRLNLTIIDINPYYLMLLHRPTRKNHKLTNIFSQ